MTEKADEAFRTISEVSAQLDIPSHVLRFWETKFSMLRPLKRSGGRRYYRPADVKILVHIRDLLYTDGFTIKGAQRLLKTKSSILSSEKDTKRNRASSDGDLKKIQSLLQSAHKRICVVKSRINS